MLTLLHTKRSRVFGGFADTKISLKKKWIPAQNMDILKCFLSTSFSENDDDDNDNNNNKQDMCNYCTAETET